MYSMLPFYWQVSGGWFYWKTADFPVTPSTDESKHMSNRYRYVFACWTENNATPFEYPKWYHLAWCCGKITLTNLCWAFNWRQSQTPDSFIVEINATPFKYLGSAWCCGLVCLVRRAAGTSSLELSETFSWASVLRLLWNILQWQMSARSLIDGLCFIRNVLLVKVSKSNAFSWTTKTSLLGENATFCDNTRLCLLPVCTLVRFEPFLLLLVSLVLLRLFSS